MGFDAARMETRGHKALFVSERDIRQGKYRLLFTAPDAIIDNRKHMRLCIPFLYTFSVLDYVIS